MAPTLDDIKRGLADNLANLPGVPSYPYLQYQLDAPATVVGPLINSEPMRRLGRLQPGQERRATWTIPIRLYIGDPTELAAQEELALKVDWNAATSFQQVIESDQSLGGIAESVEVIRVSKETTFDVGQVTFYGIEATVEVVA